MKKLAIAIPTYNEKENIVDLVEAIYEIMRGIPVSTTVIVIDDNSPDGTGDIVDQLAQKFDKQPFKVEAIHRSGKLGLGTAYIEAFKKTLSEGYDYIQTMDADFSHQPKYIPEFLKHIDEYDFVIGSRNVKGGSVEDWSVLRNIISKCGSLYARTILGVKIYDFTAGFNLIKASALKKINFDTMQSKGFGFLIELKYKLAKKGFSYKEVPIIFPNRKKGVAKMSSKIFFEAMLKIWKIRFSKV